MDAQEEFAALAGMVSNISIPHGQRLAIAADLIMALQTRLIAVEERLQRVLETNELWDGS